MSKRPAHIRGWTGRAVRGVALLACACTGVAASSLGATSSTVVGATVPSATSISTLGCPASATNFGTVLPGASVLTPADCTVTFGSSNDTSMLLAYQTDRTSQAMHGPATAAADTGFNGGSASLHMGSETLFIDAVAQADGSILAVGGSARGLVARFTPAGALDPTFAPTATIPGVLELPVGTARALAVASLPDGSMIVGGDGSGGWVAKIGPTGVVDTTFAPAGIRTIADLSSIYGIAIDGLGRILLTGGSGEFNVARLLPSGALDSSFAGDGTAYVDVGAGSSRAYRLAVAPDGRTIAAGLASNGANNDIAFVKLDERGERDAGFGVSGIRTIDRGGVEACYDMAMTPDGGAVCAGWGATDALLAKVTASGAVDSGFGPGLDGVVTWPMASTQILYGVAVEDGGAIVAGGYSTAPADMVMVRATAQGQPDGSFATGGIVTVDASGGGADEVSGVAIVDGSIVLAGYGVTSPMGYRIGYVRRYAGTRIADYANGSTDWDQGAATFGACLASVAGATATWTATGCAATDGASWRAVPRVPDATAKVATAPSTATTATASFRFGLRTASSQAAGQLRAGVTFETLAPAT